MSGSILETVRSSHEDIECMEEAASLALVRKSKRELECDSEQCVNFLVNEISSRAKQLTEFYADVDSSRTDEMQVLSGEGALDVWRAFYGRVQGVKEFAKLHPENDGEIYRHSAKFWLAQSVDKALASALLFTAEESGGKYLDLSRVHNEFINLRRLREFQTKSFLTSQWNRFLKQRDSQQDCISFEEYSKVKAKTFRPVDYITWLRDLSSFDWIPRHLKYRQKDYEDYLTSLERYLMDFQRRLRPLVDFDSLGEKFKQNFEDAWLNRRVPGWDILTAELPLYTVVTDRVFATEIALKGHLSSKEYSKAYLRWESLDSAAREELLGISRTKDYSVALLESKISFHMHQLGDVVDKTIEHITRKQARTAREVETELRKIELGETAGKAASNFDNGSVSSDGEVVEDIDDRAIYNPKNLPIGPDGKPIPYWQYKLFGLDKEFDCEICGNHTYFGRRAFEKHFSEWRHINGLRALRIQSSNHYFGITGIQDAILLHDKLRKQTASSIFNADKEMECEDAMGNIMSYKAYQDLLRQGLV